MLRPDEILKLEITDMDYIICLKCKNYFFVHVIYDSTLNDPCYCPYCGTKFNYEENKI